MTDSPVALITGAARRIGAAIARGLHQHDYRVAIHYRHSDREARALADDLNDRRLDSAIILKADLDRLTDIESLAEDTLAHWGRLDVLVNNASSFYPTPVGDASAEQWDDLINSNLKAPFFLTQALADELRLRQGCVINITDIHADRPLIKHPIYCAAKAGNAMLTKSLARELAPGVRVNGIAPGAILWPEAADESDDSQRTLLGKIPLQRKGEAEDIVQTVLFLVGGPSYITGQIIAVDGGRSIYS